MLARGTWVAIVWPVRLAVACLVVCSLSLGGCSVFDQCSDGESICQGDQIRTCDTSDDLSADWRGLGANCAPGYCVEVSGPLRTAICSTTGAIDPRCATSGSFTGAICGGSDLVQCEDGTGYSLISGCDSGTCVAPDGWPSGGAFCAESSSRDPACNDAGYGSSCDEASVITCTDGYVSSRVACPPAAVPCVAYDAGPYAYCTGE